MSSFLEEVRAELEAHHKEAFQKAWDDVVEPALKQSFKNGLETAKKEAGGNATQKKE